MECFPNPIDVTGRCQLAVGVDNRPLSDQDTHNGINQNMKIGAELLREYNAPKTITNIYMANKKRPPPLANIVNISHMTTTCGSASPRTLGGNNQRFPASCTIIRIAANSTEGICRGGGLVLIASLKATKFEMKLAFPLFGAGKKDPLGPKLGSLTAARTPYLMSAHAIILPSLVLNWPREMSIKLGGTNLCQICIGTLMEPTVPKPRWMMSTVRPTKSNLGLGLSCKKQSQNSALNESTAMAK